MLYDKLTLQYHSATTMSYATFITLSYLKVFFCIAILYKKKKKHVLRQNLLLQSQWAKHNLCSTHHNEFKTHNLVKPVAQHSKSISIKSLDILATILVNHLHKT